LPVGGFNSWKKYLNDNKEDDFFDVYLNDKYSEISDGKDDIYSVEGKQIPRATTKIVMRAIA